VCFQLVGNAQQLTIAKDFNACLYGLIDNSGKWIIPAKYNQIQPFHNRVAIVMKDNLYGLINRNGKEIVPLVYENLEAVVNDNSFYSIDNNDELNKNYNVEISPLYYMVRKNNLYGIIDTSNTAIFPCVYLTLSNFINGVAKFTSQDGKQRGFLDLHGIRGVLTIELLSHANNAEEINSGIYFLSRYELVGKSKKKYKAHFGAYNDSAKLILPIEFDSINRYAGYRGIIEAYRNGKTEYYYNDGTKVFDSAYVVPGARERKVSPLAHYLSTPAFDGNKWGVINIQGKKVLDFIYDGIQPYNCFSGTDTLGPQWEIREKNKWGIINHKGQWILKPEYDLIADYPWKTSNSIPEYVFMAKSSGHWGSVNTKGDELMPFVYDTLFSDLSGYIFWSEKTTDLLSFTNEQPYVALYKVDLNKEKTYNPYREDERVNDPGNLVFIGTNYNDAKNPEMHYQYAEYLPMRQELKISHLDEINTEDNDLFFYYSPNKKTANSSSIYAEQILDAPYNYDGPIAIARTKDGQITYNIPQVLTVDSSFTYYKINIPYNKTTFGFQRSTPEIFRSDGKIILKPRVAQDIYLLNTSEKNLDMIVTDMNSDRGVMNIHGEFLVDTIWNEIRQATPYLYWVKKENNSGNCQGEWNEYSVIKNQLLFSTDEQFLNPLYSSTVNSVAFTKTGGGIFDPVAGKFVLPPIYRAIYNLNLQSDKYAAVTCHHHIGIFDSDGKMISDTLWNSIVMISTSWNSQNPSSTTTHNKFILFSENGWAIFDTQSGITNGDSTLEVKIINETALRSAFGEKMVCPDCPWLDGLSTINFKSWQQQLIFNSLYHSSTTSDYRVGNSNNHFDCSCEVTNSDAEMFVSLVNNEEKYKRVHHTIHFQNDSTLVMEKACSRESSSEYDWEPIYSEWDFSYSNILLFPNGPRNMTLDSLFIGEEWKKVVENATMNYLNNHPGINADCNNPSMYPKIFNEMFLISSSGITFYPRWHYETDARTKERITFTIPWEDLKPYLRKDVARKIGVIKN
jgi:hypothetical protein